MCCYEHIIVLVVYIKVAGTSTVDKFENETKYLYL